MKKVLLIAFSYKKNAIGSVRLNGLAKYLPEYGWEPTILTVKIDKDSDPNQRIIETEYQDLLEKWKKKLKFKENQPIKSQLSDGGVKKNTNTVDFFLKLWMDIFAYPDLEKNWYKPAMRAGRNLLNNENFDAIISSSKPVTSHLIANDLKKEYEIPFIADMRDLWTQNHFYSFSRVRKFFDARLEKKVLNNADAIITVSEALKNKLAMNFPRDNIHVVTNGFDPDQTSLTFEPANKFTVTFTGTIYPERNDTETLFKALNELIKEGTIYTDDFELNFYGKHMNDMIGESVKNHDLGSVVNINGLIPRNKAIKKQRSSQLLLLFDWTECEEKGIYTGKIFEYLAAQRPILAVGPCKDVVSQLLIETRAGMHLSTTDEIKDQIKTYYQEYKTNGKVEYIGLAGEIEKYSQKGMARKFANVLETTTTHKTRKNQPKF